MCCSPIGDAVDRHPLPDVLVPMIHGSSDLGLVPLPIVNHSASSPVSRDSASCDHGLGALSISPAVNGHHVKMLVLATAKFLDDSLLLRAWVMFLANLMELGRAATDVGDAVKPFFAAVTVLPLVFDTHLVVHGFPLLLLEDAAFDLKLC
ncbi:hypothetical protein Nepgr_020345 [Nepenthes gracilis]|uniref:Uncharacterized protein n=1 Tax=Nepenthes gracilis TaxID=150966 RepID=A0AAD3SWS7_NEPGR|nr:hypothetical protein Nepgr_020345 [Nepenthes gracilis]